EAGRRLLARLPGEAKGAIAARARHVLRKDPRQHQPDVIRDAAIRFGAERAVFELQLRGVQPGLRLLAEELVPADDAEPGAQHDEDAEDDEALSPARLESHEWSLPS